MSWKHMIQCVKLWCAYRFCGARGHVAGNCLTSIFNSEKAEDPHKNLQSRELSQTSATGDANQEHCGCKSCPECSIPPCPYNEVMHKFEWCLHCSAKGANSKTGRCYHRPPCRSSTSRCSENVWDELRFTSDEVTEEGQQDMHAQLEVVPMGRVEAATFVGPNAEPGSSCTVKWLNQCPGPSRRMMLATQTLVNNYVDQRNGKWWWEAFTSEELCALGIILEEQIREKLQDVLKNKH